MKSHYNPSYERSLDIHGWNLLNTLHSVSQQIPTEHKIKKENLYLFVSFSPIYACAISPLSFIFCTSSKRIVASVIVFWKKNDNFQ